MFELETLAVAYDLAVKVDRINVKNCAWFEWLVRRTQLHEGAVLASPHQPSYEGAMHFMGKGSQRGGALVKPSLTAYVANELGKSAAIEKEKRKAREARAEWPGQGRGRGRGRGDEKGKGKGDSHNPSGDG